MLELLLEEFVLELELEPDNNWHPLRSRVRMIYIVKMTNIVIMKPPNTAIFFIIFFLPLNYILSRVFSSKTYNYLQFIQNFTFSKMKLQKNYIQSQSYLF